ncbi:MAG TPA: proline racemase family protein, partial [Gaiellaceae bacterium]
TVLLETGMVEIHEPETTLRLEAAAGVVEVTARCRDGRCESVELTNVPCFADRLDAQLDVLGIGTITVDVAFGGMWYAIADAEALGFALDPAEARELSRVGELIRVAAREQLPCVHPENPNIAGVSIVEIAEPWRGAGEVSKNAVVVSPGRLDRHRVVGADGGAARARADARRRRDDARLRHRLDVDGRIVSETTVGDRSAIVPAIRGRAWITGITQVFVDPTDPFPEGYLLSDTWPGDDVQAR